VVEIIETGVTLVLRVTKDMSSMAAGLGAATGLAEKIIELTQQVTHNKRRCCFVATQIRGVIKVLNTSGSKLSDKSDDQIDLLLK
jgi:hypothetical protein